MRLEYPKTPPFGKVDMPDHMEGPLKAAWYILHTVAHKKVVSGCSGNLGI